MSDSFSGAFSRRLPWHLPPNQLSVALAHKRAAFSDGGGSLLDLLDLTVSNPTRALPEIYDPALLQEHLGALADPRGLRYEPTPQGAAAARAAVAGYYGE